MKDLISVDIKSGMKLYQIIKKYKIGQLKLYEILKDIPDYKPKNQYKQYENEIINLYKEGFTLNFISKKYNISKWTIIRICQSNGIESKRSNKNLLIKYGADRKVIEDSKSFFIMSCECGAIKKVLTSGVRIGKKWKCQKCSFLLENTSDKAASKKKAVNNTSGFIGIGVYYTNGKVRGYSAFLRYRKIMILKNKYPDSELYEKTLIQAAVDRDVFIIQNNLPHTRNFTDVELIGNMEYLAHEQIDNIKNYCRGEN